jgi:hypothetical protein
MNDKKNRPPDFEPKIVTPEFVRLEIKFALENKWDTKKGMTYAIEIQRRTV